MDLRTHHSVNHQIANQSRVGVRLVGPQYNVRLEADAPRRRGRRAAMVALNAADCNHAVKTTLDRLRQ